MSALEVDHEAEIVRLTKAAVEAACSGRWDVVTQCYRDRGILLESSGGTIDRGEDLMVLDHQVRNHVRTAQALVASLLEETAATRRRVQGLRQRLGVSALAPEAMSVEA